MEISLYNEDTSEYFGIVDVPDDYANALIKEAELSGCSVEDFIRQLIMEIIDDRRQALEAES